MLQAIWLQCSGVTSNRVPFTSRGAPQLLLTIQTLLKAFYDGDTLPHCQRGSYTKTPAKFYQLLASGPQNQQLSAYAHTADLVLGVFFFAMCSFKCTKPAWLGGTKWIQMGGILFRTQSRHVLLLTDCALLKLDNYVTIICKEQKNGKKMGACSQQRIVEMIPDWTNKTTLCLIAIDDKVMEISNVFVRQVWLTHLLPIQRFATFSFHPYKILATNPFAQ
jgi:hypothetical protein